MRKSSTIPHSPPQMLRMHTPGRHLRLLGQSRRQPALRKIKATKQPDHLPDRRNRGNLPRPLIGRWKARRAPSPPRSPPSTQTTRRHQQNQIAPGSLMRQVLRNHSRSRHPPLLRAKKRQVSRQPRSQLHSHSAPGLARSSRGFSSHPGHRTIPAQNPTATMMSVVRAWGCTSRSRDPSEEQGRGVSDARSYALAKSGQVGICLPPVVVGRNSSAGRAHHS